MMSLHCRPWRRISSCAFRPAAARSPSWAEPSMPSSLMRRSVASGARRSIVVREREHRGGQLGMVAETLARDEVDDLAIVADDDGVEGVERALDVVVEVRAR